MIKKRFILFCLLTMSVVSHAVANEIKSPHSSRQVSDQFIAKQRAKLAKHSKGFGPQSPRDIRSVTGSNRMIFSAAPPYDQMNLCNIHFHKSAEHEGGEFTKYAGNGDGRGHQTGYLYSGHLSKEELRPVAYKVCPGPNRHDNLRPGDTIELHYVYTTSPVVLPAKPKNRGLNACFASSAVKNPQLRVEAQVLVLVNDKHAMDFRKLTQVGERSGYFQALNVPDNTGTPVQYAGSTTGAKYNTKGSAYQVTWSVRPKVIKVNIATVKDWCGEDIFKEKHAQTVRNLVINPALLSNFYK